MANMEDPLTPEEQKKYDRIITYINRMPVYNQAKVDLIELVDALVDELIYGREEDGLC